MIGINDHKQPENMNYICEELGESAGLSSNKYRPWLDMVKWYIRIIATSIILLFYF